MFCPNMYAPNAELLEHAIVDAEMRMCKLGDTAHESESIRTRTDRIHAVVLAGTVVEAVSHAPVDEASFGSLRRGLADTSSGHTDRMPARRQRPGGGRRRRDSLGDSSASN
jgi:hypothetical protein